MKLKWYIEFPVVLLMMILGIVFAWSENLSSCNSDKTAKKPAVKKDLSQLSPEETKWMDGKDLFRSNCAPCHNPKTDGTGPALKGVTARWKAAGAYQGKTGEEWLKMWIHNWNDVVKAGYKYGVDMSNSRAAKMNVFPYLSNAEIDKIMFYVDSPDGVKPEVVTK